MRPVPDPDPGTPDHRSADRYLLWVGRRHRGVLALGSVCATVYVICQGLPPALIGQAVDAGLVTGDLGAVAGWAALLLLAGVTQAVFSTLADRTESFADLQASYTTAQVVTRRAARLGAALRGQASTGEVVTVGSSDIEEIGSLADHVPSAVASVLFIAAVSGYLLASSVLFGVVVLVCVPLIVVLMSLLLGPYQERAAQHRELLSGLTTQAVDIVSGLRVLRGIGGEAMFARGYRTASQRVRAAGVRVGRFDALLGAAEILLPGLLVAGVVWFGARMALAGEITPGQLVAFYGYAAMLVVPVQTLTTVAERAIDARVAAARVVRVLNLERDVTSPAAPVPGPTQPCAPHDPVSGVRTRAGILTAVACADPGDAEAIAERLTRFADADPPAYLAQPPLPPGAAPGVGEEKAPHSNRLAATPGPRKCDPPPVDNPGGRVALRAMDLGEVRRRIVLSGNDDRIFPGPLGEELAPGRADPARIAAAVHAAAATDVVAALEGGLDTAVSDRGLEFSGGQRQRLRLARALLTDAEILVLVEPASAVDAHTEAAIGERLAKHRTGRTTVVFTTSPLLLDHAEHVVHVASGRAGAEGSHAELLRTDPGYLRTVHRGVLP